VFEETMPSRVAAGSAVRRSRFDADQRVLALTLDDGHVLEADVGLPGQARPPEAPAVYLDQNHWISLAQHAWAPHRLRASERDAAATVIALARARRIVLPLSAAHLTELPPVAGRRRRDLAATILGLCRGWQMRSPIRVRFGEYTASMLGRDPLSSEVFTLEPGVLFAEGPARPSPPPGAPAVVQDAFTRVTAVSAMYSAVLDDDPLDTEEGRKAAARWAQGFPELAAFMREDRTNERDARLNTRARLMADQRPELARAAHVAGISVDRFSQWLKNEFPDQLQRMPFVGRLNEVLYSRLRNADDKWAANDLNDLNYLCCAAAYADITVGERKTIEYLRRAEPRVRPGSALCRNLSEAVSELADRGISV
jgi:hypothetical protein